jgi:hypothetical protein
LITGRPGKILIGSSAHVALKDLTLLSSELHVKIKKFRQSLNSTMLAAQTTQEVQLSRTSVDALQAGLVLGPHTRQGVSLRQKMQARQYRETLHACCFCGDAHRNKEMKNT